MEDHIPFASTPKRKTFLANIRSLRWWFGLRPKEITGTPALYRSISVVIPAHNEASCITATIESVRRQTYPVAEIIVVDDASTDGTGDIARALGVRVIRTPHKTGSKALAQNHGISVGVTTDLFATLDADTILKEDAIAHTLPFFSDWRTCAVCGFIIPQRIKTFWERGRFIEYLVGFGTFKSAQDHQGMVLVASGCFTVFDTQLVKQFGGFRERTMAEDMDLTWELIAHGYRVYYTPKAISYTIDPPTFAQYFHQIDRWYRGFLQNIKVRNYNLCPIGKGFACVVYLYVLWNLCGAFGLPLLLYFATQSAVDTGLGVLFFQAFFVLPPTLIAAWKHGLLLKALTSLPAFLILPYVNSLVYIRSVWKEFIRGESLREWHKGH